MRTQRAKAKAKPKSKSKTRRLPDTYKSKGQATQRKTLTKARVAARKKAQTGTQTKGGRADDARTKARYPGVRESASGRTYTERRRNRSDASKTRKR